MPVRPTRVRYHRDEAHLITHQPGPPPAPPGGGKQFQPTDIANLRFWYDASDLTTIADTSGDVTQWNDKSGNGLHLTPISSALGPTTGTRTKNGRNVLDFDNASPGTGFATRSLGRDAFKATAALYTMFVVMTNDVSPSTNPAGAVLCGVVGTCDGLQVLPSTARRAEITTGGVRDADGPVYTNSVWGVWTVIVNSLASGNQLILRQNGVQVATANPAGGSFGTAFRIACFNGGNRCSNIAVAEIVGYTDNTGTYPQLNAGQLQRVETYLINRWALP